MTQRIVLLFATREGHTRKVVEYLAGALRSRDIEVELRNVADLAGDATLDGFDTAVLAASIHAGGHEREMVKYVRRHRTELTRLRAALVSVSLSEAGAEDQSRDPEARARFAADVAGTIRAFEKATGWRPARVRPVAGALAYTRYNPLVRIVMKRIASKVGASTDTTRDHEYTDWPALDRFAAEIAAEISMPGALATSAPG